MADNVIALGSGRSAVKPTVIPTPKLTIILDKVEVVGKLRKENNPVPFFEEGPKKQIHHCKLSRCSNHLFDRRRRGVCLNALDIERMVAQFPELHK